MKPIAVMVPCRAGSQRVKDKNTRPFGGRENGLLEIKLGQLCAMAEIDDVVVSTDDPKVMELAEGFRAHSLPRISVVERPPELAVAATLDDFLAYVPTIMPEGSVVAWTHVTSPFFGRDWMAKAVAAYRTHVECGDHDSLMSVSAIQSFLWDEEKCISHDRSKVRWPQTQDLPRFFDVNSALFMIDQAEFLRRRDRIGDRPFLLETDSLAGIDIDWPEDFETASRIFQALDL
ncbi:MAG: acylneuraminate cytidylyltransferase family protein [Pseudomonadota bacterium]